VKPESIVKLVRQEWVKRRNSEEVGKWRRIVDAVVGQLNITLPISCLFCGEHYRTRSFFNHFENHLFRIIQHFDYSGHPMQPQLGFCVDCGKFVIAPNKGVAYSSLSHLKREGYTGDWSGAGYCEYHNRFENGGLYCMKCMKKTGWQWGEKEEKQ